MSRSGEIALEFGGEERTFRLALGQWRKVQEKCDAGPGELLSRLGPAYVARQQGLNFNQMLANGYLGAWRIDDVREPILQGLLGGGMDAKVALDLVKDWIDERPLFEAVGVAYQVVLASVIGAPDEAAAGESDAVAEASQTSPAANSGSERTATTPPAAPSTGTPETSTS